MLKHHAKIERNSIWLLIGIVIVIAIGGLVEIVPLFRIETTIEKVSGMRPLTPLELAGEQLYIREGCSNCHSQQIRPLRDEVERYGHYSLAAESMYDHPFLWGSKRTGPDLARVGGKYSDEWHTAHLTNPRDVVPESIMPAYGFMMNNGVNLLEIGKLMKTYQMVGVPYTDDMIEQAYNDAVAQANPDADPAGLNARYGKKVNLRDFDGQRNFISEADALVAYLQSLGTLVDIKDYKIEEPKP
jgi:cytochrome c oxidase cbb3-type subunit 2